METQLMFLAFVVLAGTVILGISWRTRVRAVRRMRAAANAHAARELAQQALRKTRKGDVARRRRMPA
jgi:hypothetical protein